jgi:glycosyltransferase involved in cell wall biosynthesis
MVPKLLFIGAINLSNSPRGGEDYKNQLIFEKLMHSNVFDTIEIDTYNWKKKPLLVANLFLKLLFSQFDSIVISASSASTYFLLKIISKIKPSILFKIHYLVIGGYFPEGIRSKRYDWKIYNNLKSIVVEGEILKKQFVSCTKLKNLQVISNFKKFDYEISLKEKERNCFKFVFIGRISKPKGILEIIEAVSILKAGNPEMNFSVDFYGPVEDKIEFPEGLSLNYMGYLDIMNNQQKSYATLSEYSCMLFPTHWKGEGFPGVIIDAYIAGLPVIATDWSMNKEVVIHGETGLIVPIQDVNALAMAMLQVLQNPELVKKMSDNSLKKANNFHIDVVWPQIDKLIYKSYA